MAQKNKSSHLIPLIGFGCIYSIIFLFYLNNPSDIVATYWRYNFMLSFYFFFLLVEKSLNYLDKIH